MRNEWANPWRRRPVTLMLVVACVGIWLGLGNIEQDKLLFSMPDIMHGEVWRLVTPILLHAGLIHLAFNMWVLVDLGTLVERRIGSVRYAVMVAAIAVSVELCSVRALRTQLRRHVGRQLWAVRLRLGSRAARTNVRTLFAQRSCLHDDGLARALLFRSNRRRRQLGTFVRFGRGRGDRLATQRFAPGKLNT